MFPAYSQLVTYNNKCT